MTAFLVLVSTQMVQASVITNDDLQSALFSSIETELGSDQKKFKKVDSKLEKTSPPFVVESSVIQDSSQETKEFEPFLQSSEKKFVKSKTTIKKVSMEGQDPVKTLLKEKLVGTVISQQFNALKPNFLDPLSLGEAVSYAIKNNDKIHAVKARRKGAWWDHMGAYAQYMPSVEFNYAEGAETSMPGSYNDSSGSRVSRTEHHRRDRRLFIRQPLIDLTIVSDIVRTSKTLDVAEIEAVDSQESTVWETVGTYMKLLRARKLLELSEDRKRILEDLQQRIQARFDGGGATAADISRVQSRLSVVEAERLRSIGEYGALISDLKRLTKVVPAQFKTAGKLIPDVPVTPQEALIRAWEGNPSYLAAKKKGAIAQADRDKSISGMFPRLSLEYSDSYVYNAGGAAHGNAIDGVYPNQSDKRLMLVASWSLPGGTSITSSMSGVAKMREMKFLEQDVRMRIEQGIMTAYNSLNTVRRRLSVLKENYVSDKKLIDTLEDQFMQGGKSLFEILDSQDRFYTTKVELLKAVFDEALTAYQIRLQMGQISMAVLESGKV